MLQSPHPIGRGLIFYISITKNSILEGNRGINIGFIDYLRIDFCPVLVYYGE